MHFYKTEKERHTHRNGEGNVTPEAEMEGYNHKPRNVSSHQMLIEAERGKKLIVSWSLRREHGPEL